jgi:hypothetical protein
MKRCVLIVCLAVIAPFMGGCMTKAEQEFTAADVHVISLYIQDSQPANEYYADALEASGQVQKANQHRADTRALADEIGKNAAARMDRVSAETQLVESARAAVKVARAMVEAYAKHKAANTEVSNVDSAQ